MLVDDIPKLIMRHRFRFNCEDDLQLGLAEVFQNFGLPFTREVQLCPGSRIDFILDEGLGLEVKIKGSLSSLTAQLFRYSLSDKISALILVTSRSFHTDFPRTLNHKPLRVAYLSNL